MRLSVNLRGDLRHLSDEALAARYEAAVTERTGLPKHSWLEWPPRWQGPVRHPRAYRFWLFLGGLAETGFPAPWPFLLAALFSGRRSDALIAAHPAARLCRLDWEIMDLTDEIQRRITRRRRQALPLP